MIETNCLWMASYLHEMLGSYVEEAPHVRTGSRLYEETLLAAYIVDLGILSFDDGFLGFIKENPGAKASYLYQVVRRFPDETVRNGAALMIERLTATGSGNGLLSLTTGIFERPHMETGVHGPAFRPVIRPEIRKCDCREIRPGVWTVEPL